MCKAILESKTPGDGYTVINTTMIEAKLRKILVNFINDLKIVQDLGMFSLPKDEMFPDKNLTSDDSVSLQVCLITKHMHINILINETNAEDKAFFRLISQQN